MSERQVPLVPAHRRRQDLCGELQKRLVETSQQNDRPLREPGKFLCQAVIGSDGETRAGGGRVSILENALPARVRVEKHAPRAKLVGVFRERGHRERFRRVERMPGRPRTAPDPAKLESHGLPVEQTQDPPQGTYPTELAVAPAHRLLPRDLAHRLGQQIPKQLLYRDGRLFEQGEIELPFR